MIDDLNGYVTSSLLIDELLLDWHSLRSHCWLSIVSIVNLLLRLDLGYVFERVYVVRVHNVVSHEIIIERDHTLVLQEILHLEQIVSLLLHLHQVLFLLFSEKVSLVLGVLATKGSCLGQLLLESPLLGLSGGVGADSILPKEIKHLSWNFLESLFCKLHRIVCKVPEWNKLNDISCHLLFVILRVKRYLVCIQLIHSTEVSLPNTNDDDR